MLVPGQGGFLHKYRGNEKSKHCMICGQVDTNHADVIKAMDEKIMKKLF
jgi:hypothetical protein